MKWIGYPAMVTLARKKAAHNTLGRLTGTHGHMGEGFCFQNPRIGIFMGI